MDMKESTMDRWIRMVVERIYCKKGKFERIMVKNYHCGEAILVIFCCVKVWLINLNRVKELSFHEEALSKNEKAQGWRDAFTENVLEGIYR